MTYKYEQEILDKGLFIPKSYMIDYPPYVVNHRSFEVNQHPLQLSALMEYLEDKEINTYLEIGVCEGGTFSLLDNLLRKKNPNLVSFALDIDYPRVYMKRYLKETPNTFFIKADSKDLSFGKAIDFVFIDGDHSLESVKNDYLTFGKIAKIVALHDIFNSRHPDVGEYWDKIRLDKNYLEFGDTYKDKNRNKLLGIGVIVNDI